MEETYTNRTVETDWVKTKVNRTITGQDGWTALAPEELAPLMQVGDEYTIETRGNYVSGWLFKGTWYNHKSDQEIERQHEEVVAENKRKSAEYADSHRAEWTERENKLPEWAKKVLAKNREKEDDFDNQAMGWGYILIALELAALYVELGEDINQPDFEEPENIREFHQKNGTSGYQAGWARGIARRQIAGTLEAELNG